MWNVLFVTVSDNNKHMKLSWIKGKPDREIIFNNIHENGVCNISITTIPFVIWMLSHVSLCRIEWPRIPNFLTKCVINTVWATFINYASFSARYMLQIGCKELPVRLCSMTWNCCVHRTGLVWSFYLTGTTLWISCGSVAWGFTQLIENSFRSCS